MSDKELKPCPFCGGKAILEESKFGLNVISCESCEETMQALHVDNLIKAWNTRVDNVAKTDECCKKSCKQENATLDSAINHCKEIISKMDNCPCKKDHEVLLGFLEELKVRREQQPLLKK